MVAALVEDITKGAKSAVMVSSFQELQLVCDHWNVENITTILWPMVVVEAKKRSIERAKSAVMAESSPENPSAYDHWDVGDIATTH